MGALHRTRAWRKLRDQVVAEEPLCQLRIPGICTGRSQTGDHVEPVIKRPDLALVRENVQGACYACNRWKWDKDPAEVEDERPSEALRFFE